MSTGDVPVADELLGFCELGQLIDVLFDVHLQYPPFRGSFMLC